MKSKHRFHIGFWGSVVCHAIIAILLAAAGIFEVSKSSDHILEVAIVGGGSGKGGGAEAGAVQAPVSQPREMPQVKPVLPDDIVENKKENEEKMQPVPEPVPHSGPKSRADTDAAGMRGSGTEKPQDGSGMSGRGSGDVSGGGAGEGAGPASGIGSPAVPPRLIYQREPDYPKSVRNREIEGTTVVRLLIGVAGDVEASSVDKSSGSRELDAAAAKALKEWKFVPAKDSYGRNMRCYVYIPVNFRLR